ncbi:universal stress protein [Phenylobacterium montanum]|uniref:Universal stress protein n=1 Tax=Phenylobacterium montanum TaxID=2823693 RepID=A0A975G1Y8_9CAUL|nr:universal stress protein [Caulobacter sp. S6]QUD89638.1 universal stress protein [Caulobacter sp. S6]
MYERILLATDETRESLTALREGALLAHRFQSSVFLLVVITHSTGALMADSVYPAPRPTQGKSLLEAGLDRLHRLGLEASGAVVTGEPAVQIGAAATKFKADLIVVGHRRQSLLDRWWSGASGGYIVDQVGCSVLIARNCVSDEEFERLLAPR